MSKGAETRNMDQDYDESDLLGLESVHPYGVKPEGNAIMDMFLKKVTPCRDKGLGYMRVLPDSLLLNVLSYLDGKSLAKLSPCSKSLYVFSHHEDLWRTLTLTTYGSDWVYSKDGWKQTFRAKEMNVHPDTLSHKPLKIEGFYSDYLFKTHICSAADIDPKWLSFDNLPRRSYKEMSLADFRSEFEDKNLPVIITDCASEWEIMKNLTSASLSEEYGHIRFHCAGFDFTLQDYLEYSRKVKDDQPLYLFDKHFAKKAPEIAKKYTVPRYFADDLFKVMGEDHRPDWRWLIIGPRKSGSTFHKDPNGTSAWNACLTGSKLWLFCPPHMSPPGVFASEDGSEVASPLSVIEWLIDFYDQFAEQRDELWQAHTTDQKKGARPTKRKRAASHDTPSLVRRLRTRSTLEGGSGSVTGLTGNLSKTFEANRQNQDVTTTTSRLFQNAGHTIEHNLFFQGITRPGEVMFVPQGWWHAVLNLDESIAITHNYVSPSNLPGVLAFTRDSPYAVSGIPDSAVEGFYSRFRKALHEQCPDVLDKAEAKLNEMVANRPEKRVESTWAKTIKKPSADSEEGTFSLAALFDKEIENE